MLRVAGLELPALRLVDDPASGTAGAILGYPENGPFDVQPGRIGRTQNVITQNAYGEGPVSRLLTPLRGLVRPGNSGGPLVDADGRVLTTVFASTVGRLLAGRLRGRRMPTVAARARREATSGCRRQRSAPGGARSG